jgi:hypothetical protein
MAATSLMAATGSHTVAALKYGGYAQAPALADLTFRCDVDYRGYIRDVDIDRRR